MIRIAQPAMAINDPRVHEHFQMWNTWTVTRTQTVAHMATSIAAVAKRAPGGKLRNLVISCHGLPGYLHLGEGIEMRNVYMFNVCKGLIEKIWITACLVGRVSNEPFYSEDFARTSDSKRRNGHLFCQEFARTTGAWIVTPTETQKAFSGTVAPGHVTSFEGLVLSYSPKGQITWVGRNPSEKVPD